MSPHTTGQWHKNATRKLKATSNNPQLDSLLLLEYVLGANRALLLAHLDTALTKEQLKKLASALTRRLNHEPIAYITNSIEFYRRSFYVDTSVLIPRPESEDIISLLLELKLPPSSTVGDIGTGSGALAITAKLEQPPLNVIAFDNDQAALSIAHKNATLHKTQDITFFKRDFFCRKLNYTAMLVNLPYVPDGMKDKKDISHEPENALFSGADGLSHYRSFFAKLATLKQKPRYLLCESLTAQHTAMMNLAKTQGYQLTQTCKLIQLFEQLVD